MISKIHDDGYWLVEHTPSNGLLKVTRSAKAYGPPAEIEASLKALTESLSTLDPTSLRVLLDLREGPGRNDDAFEKTMLPHQYRLLRKVRRFAWLVRTAAGRLQILRLSKGPAMVFLDEDEAFEYLLAAE